MSDLDGTLLPDSAQLEPFMQHRINRLIDGGVLFTVATARAYPSIRTVLGGVRLRLPIIEQNGALVRNYESGEILSHAALRDYDTQSILRVFATFGVDPVVSLISEGKNVVQYRRLSNAGMRWYIQEKVDKRDERLRAVERFSLEAGARCLDITYLGNAEDVDALSQKITHATKSITVIKHRNAYVDAFELNIASSNCGKGCALRSIRSHLYADEIVAFGDNSNDIDLFDAAEHRIAVANGTTDIKRRASLVIGDNNSGSVVRFIEEWTGIHA